VTRRAAIAVVLVVLSGCGGDDAGGGASAAAGTPERFLDRFVAADGRVVRQDHGGDTVSEGQAYAMLLAVATGDERRFDRVWSWTRRHLQRDDRLLSWHWRDGQVVDRQPATDADLDAAHALVRAARRFGRPALARQGRRIGRSILKHETAGGRVLLAGPWAHGEGVINPSYVDYRAFATLGRRGNRRAWRRLAAGNLRVLESLTRGALAPDWARVDGGGATPTGPPKATDATPTYGYDAVRVPIRLAAACQPTARRIAAAHWSRLRDDPAILPRTLDGAPADAAGESAAALAGAAAAADVAGDRDDARRLLDDAAAREAEHPTYYGSALVALAYVTLTGRKRC
jgi:endoglucanase